MTRSIRTYAMPERAGGAEFEIHDERATARIGEAHRHEYFQIQLNLAGRSRCYVGATERVLDAGYASFVLPYKVHRVVHAAGSRFYVINFRQRFLRPDLDVDTLDLEEVPLERAPELAPFRFQEFMDFRLSGADLAAARRACRRMVFEARQRALCWREVVRGELLLLLALVCRRHEAGLLRLAAVRVQTRRRRQALSRVMRHIRANLARRVSLAEAAAAADLSPNYLAHLVKRETGRTFTDIVTERRMEEALALLAHTTLRISEISAAVGFDDEAYFARRFRQCFDVAPREYRDGLAGTATRPARRRRPESSK